MSLEGGDMTWGDIDRAENGGPDGYYGPEVHTYLPDAEGRCTSGWYNDRLEWVACRSTQRSSVLHDDPEAAFRQLHHHDGGDCMCFEDESGPTYHQAMAAYVEEHTP